MSRSKIRSKIAGKVIGRGGTDVYAPLFDGLTQYAALPDINLSAGDVVSFEIISPSPSGLQMLLSNTGAYKTVVRINADGTMYSEQGVITLDGLPGQTVTPGMRQKVSFTTSVSALINLAAAQSNGSGGVLRLAACQIFNLKVNDGAIFNFAMNDKDSDPVMVNSGSGANGSYVNSTAAMWVKV